MKSAERRNEQKQERATLSKSIYSGLIIGKSTDVSATRNQERLKSASRRSPCNSITKSQISFYKIGRPQSKFSYRHDVFRRHLSDIIIISHYLSPHYPYLSFQNNHMQAIFLIRAKLVTYPMRLYKPNHQRRCRVVVWQWKSRCVWHY